MSDTTEVEAFRRRARTWLAANLPRREAGAGRRGARGGGAESTDEERAAQRRAQRALYDAGLAGITWPAEYGGQGLTADHERAFREEAAGYELPPPPGGVGYGIVGPTLLAYASEDQKQDWIPKILSGEESWVQFLSEPGAGSDLAGILTRAVRDGEEWVITGSKIWSTGALHCDAAMCLARTNWDVPKHKGLTWFKVPIPTPGLTILPVREINGGADFCQEFLDDVRVPAANVIGEVDGGWPIANALLAFERGAAGGGGGGGGARVPTGRRRLAPDLVELARNAGVLETGQARQEIARAHVNQYLHEAMAERVVGAMRAGQMTSNAASLLKLSTGILDPIRAMIGMRLAGPAGVAWGPQNDDGNQASVTYLNGRIMSIAGGSNQVQRNLVAERLLGLPREPSFDSDKPFTEVQRDAHKWTGAR